VKNKLAMAIGVAALVVLLASLATLGYLRAREARQFSERHAVRTYGGTNYVATLQQTTIGRTAAGYIVILAVEFENPNPFPVRLDRNWFILVDHDKDFYLPATTGTHERWIDLPARGTVEKETLSYAVPADSFAGVIAVQLGHQYWTLVKEVGEFTEPLADGQFRSFRRRHW